MRISDWSSDVCSSDLLARAYEQQVLERARGDTSAFDQIYAQYELAPEVTRKRLYYETMENVLSNVEKPITKARGVTPYFTFHEVQKRLKEHATPQQGGRCGCPRLSDTHRQRADERQ